MVISHPHLGRTNMALTPMSDDPDQQVRTTIGLMRGYAVEDAGRREIQRVMAPVANSPNPWEKIHHAYSIVKGRLRFVQDRDLSNGIEGVYTNPSTPMVEVLVRPVDVMNGSSGVGDCDDFSMLLASLLTSCGVPVSFVTVAADPAMGRAFSHVYVAAYPGGKNGPRVPLDASHGQYPGWEVENRLGRRVEWPVNWSGAGNGDEGDSPWA